MEYVKQQILEFTDTNLVDTYPVWAEGTTYSFEATAPTSASIVRYGAWYYRSVANGNVGNNPEDTEGTWWVKYGVSNKFAMLDLKAQSFSTFDGDMTCTFTKGNINTLGFGNYTALSITVDILDIDGITVLDTQTTSNTYYDHIEDWYTFTQVGEADIGDRATRVKLPNIGSFIKVTFNIASEFTYTSCGYMIGGEAVYMGDTIDGVNFSFASYASKETDTWGNLNIVKRAVQDLVDFETIIDSNRASSFKRKVKSVYNDIIMFIVDDTDESIFENILVLGVIQDAGVVFGNSEKTVLNFSVMESI